jgi:hypothetical protein
LARPTIARKTVANAPKSFQQVLRELWELLKTYARQETFGPLKNLGWQLKWGVPGAVFVSLGVFLLAIGILRGFEQITWFEAHNYLSYLVVVAFLLIVLYLVWRKMKAAVFSPNRKARG